MADDNKRRCAWCEGRAENYVEYHDREWGVAEHDDRKLFEMLVLESFQAGLSWACVLGKREAFRRAFSGFDCKAVAAYGESDVERLMLDAGIVRNRLKIRAAVGNARVFMEIQRECGSFNQYIWGFTGGETVFEVGLISSPLSDRVAADLRRRGMRFVGTTIVYSYLQAIGVVNSHEPQCWLYAGAGRRE